MVNHQRNEKESSEKWDLSDLDTAEEDVLPFYESPFRLNGECHDFTHLRHKSNLIELFFDLFLAADLATFTESHSIVDRGSLIAYVGFFLIIWSTWFQITLHDIRFVQDSIYERVCKILQFTVFVSFALVGADFSSHEESSGEDSPKQTKQWHQHLNFWLLSFTLFFSRALLAIQYTVVLCGRNRPSRLKLPLIINVVVFLISGAVFVGLADVFTKSGGASENGSSIAYITWYFVLLFEVVGVIQISTLWKDINFESTHLTERMGLLTFIVIGEGAIGASKTTIELMGGRPLEFEPIFLVVCIVVILVLLWMLYFDNLPSTPHGSTWQQVWACLHLPLHLSFVGILEGSRQVAMMRYISQALHGFVAQVDSICLHKHLDGKVLGDKLMRLVDAYDFGVLHPTADQYIRMREAVFEIGNIPGICSVQNTLGKSTVFDPITEAYPRFKELLYHFATALFISDGAEEISASSAQDAFALMERSIVTIYLYYWSSVLAMLFTVILLYMLNRRKGNDLAYYCSIAGRCIMAVFTVVLVALYSDTSAWTSFITSRAMLPTLCGILSFVVLVDWVGRRIRVTKARNMRASRLEQETQDHISKGGSSSAVAGSHTRTTWVESVDEVEDAYKLRASRRRGVVLTTRQSMYNWLMPPLDHHHHTG